MQNNTFFGHSNPSNVIVLEETTSTNDYAKNLLSIFKPHNNFTAILAKNQTNGRGQRGNAWFSQASRNLTTSIIYSPQELKINEQFTLTTCSSLALYDVITKHTSQQTHIKWPNDILVDNKKIAGILIENKIAGEYIKHSIIGIGVNVFQKDFNSEIAHKTSSLSLLNFETNVTILDLLIEIRTKLISYLEIVRWDFQKALSLYNDKLYLKDLPSNFIYQNQRVIGTIKHVDQDGFLHIDINDNLHKISLKEIEYVL